MLFHPIPRLCELGSIERGVQQPFRHQRNRHGARAELTLGIDVREGSRATHAGPKLSLVRGREQWTSDRFDLQPKRSAFVETSGSRFRDDEQTQETHRPGLGRRIADHAP